MQTRPPAVAGTFYPADPKLLRAQIDRYLAAVPHTGPVPKALIAPHAGYAYSGPIAASAYGRVRDGRGRIERVVLLGPAHRVGVRGMATTTADSFDTPLGPLLVDRQAIMMIERLPGVQTYDRAHEQEHSLEVHLPFIKVALGDVKLVPIAVGDATVEEVATVLDALWGGPETLIVVSSDLSHYLDYSSARAIDAETTRAVEALAFERIGDDQACGRVPMRGLLAVAARRGMHATTLDVRNSGDTSDKRDWVVGYGAWAIDQ
jgi:AmmeMemoRadiSam system protein B